MYLPHSLVVTSAPAAEPITAAEAKLHLRVDHSEEDTLIASLLTAARQLAETYTQRSFVTQTLAMRLAGFPCGVLYLPRPPLVSVSSVAYVDTAGDSQTWSSANYVVDSYGDPGRISTAYGISWPTTREQMNAVTVTYIAGYGAYTAVPDVIKAGVKLILGHLYENREATISGTIINEIPLGAKALLDSVKVGVY